MSVKNSHKMMYIIVGIILSIGILILCVFVTRGSLEDLGSPRVEEWFDPIPTNEQMASGEALQGLYAASMDQVTRTLSGIRLASTRISPKFANDLVAWMCSTSYSEEAHESLFKQICFYAKSEMEPALVRSLTSRLAEESTGGACPCCDRLAMALHSICSEYPKSVNHEQSLKTLEAVSQVARSRNVN